ncbi:flagellar basal body-associated protein FliL [Cytobacillus purgationiresistens]|uniref:Flagellar protein FliL n=1 Tax=Cytobacillus purgationiresistens TaxID=863449 RepID=A0ABU0AG35_9BACI|nr:flagellar basal body-associated protein FliL [Cytobacillus purgationiresistens]MDQ0270221.1 flagellar FliL protein [Cytobacillus purgationiresistens]
MKKSKWIMGAVITFSLLLVVVAVMYFTEIGYTQKANAEPTIDEILESSVNIPQITTNLASNDFIRISFTIQTDSKQAKVELEKRDFQVKNLIIQELSEMNAEEIQGKEGQVNLQDELKVKINSLMHTGKIEQVYITESILQ